MESIVVILGLSDTLGESVEKCVVTMRTVDWNGRNWGKTVDWGMEECRLTRAGGRGED